MILASWNPDMMRCDSARCAIMVLSWCYRGAFAHPSGVELSVHSARPAAVSSPPPIGSRPRSNSRRLSGLFNPPPTPTHGSSTAYTNSNSSSSSSAAATGVGMTGGDGGGLGGASDGIAGTQKKKKQRAFFPSDISMNIDGSTGQAASAGASHQQQQQQRYHYHTPPVQAKTPFVLLLGDHTYQQFCVGLQVPMQFRDAEYGVTICTTYILCLMTKLPFFSYFFHLLDQFDTTFEGFKFERPIPTQDMSFPYIAELRPLNDFAGKLKRLMVPIYPYVISSPTDVKQGRNRGEVGGIGAGGKHRAGSTVEGKDGRRGRADSQGWERGDAILSGSNPASPRGGVLSQQNGEDSAEASDNRMVVLPDVELGMGVRNSRKVSVTFPRSRFQPYFSGWLGAYDSSNKELQSLLTRYSRTATSFTPKLVHRLEKDKEDSFMVLLWALPVLLKYLPLDQIILALGCAVTEMKIIVKHKDFHVISSIILALVQLLKPLKWCSPVIVILPDHLIDFIGE